jgi:hypothetical protein
MDSIWGLRIHGNLLVFSFPLSAFFCKESIGQVPTMFFIGDSEFISLLFTRLRVETVFFGRFFLMDLASGETFVLKHDWTEAVGFE